jgi:hypothetical protein
LLASSALGGNSNENISYNAAAGSYVVRVFGYAGAFSALQCYALGIFSQCQSCGPITGMTTSSITTNSAVLSWTGVQGANNYDVMVKPTSSANFTTISGVAGTSYTYSGLNASTSYDWRVKPNCQGASSEFSQVITFTTAPCESAPTISLSARMILEGPYKTANGLMADSLRTLGLIPLTEPYSIAGLAVSGPTTTTAAVLAVTSNNAIVDWVIVELRNATTPATVVERKVALLQRDGDVVGVTGTGPVGFCSAAGNYFVSVRHRNHFGCMTSAAQALSGAFSVDFTLVGTATYGTEARKAVGAVQVLWAGNTSNDANLQYTGAGNDRDPILLAIGGNTPNNVVSGYLGTDVNMDGRAKYTGLDNDRDPILVNVGSTTPNNVRVQQLP